MARETVDFGIDLGTTNSAIAVSTGADAQIVRNNLRAGYTPSAVYVNRSGHVQVGKRARDKADSDPANSHAEFKLQMGVRDARRTFRDSGRTMTPEQLSAEVLKSVRQDVRRERDEEISAAVITVPAAFELDQCDATRRAAALAGLEFAPLLQEPTAAAWAYSAVAADVPRRGFWLVYDFGGGTFDAAVIQLEDGEFTVVNHAGDNFLGGKLIDWALVEGVLLPAARAVPALASLERSDPQAAGNIAKLKLAAEEAKIELSHSTAVEVDLELTDPRGDRVEFTHELTRADVERVSPPLYRRSVEMCRRALAEKGLATGDIERVLLVGGATLAPALRELLADPREGLGIRLYHSLDPVTVVARGAAVFARTQRLPHGFGRGSADAGDVRQTPDIAELGRQSEAVAGQYRELRRKAGSTGADRTTELPDDFDRRGGLGQITRELESAQVSPDGPAICQELLRKAESALDETEQALELPQLAQEATSVRDWVREVAGEYGDPDSRNELRAAERELAAAVEAGDPTMLSHRTEVVRNIGLRLLDSAGHLPVLRFRSLKEGFANSSDPRVKRLLREGEAVLAAQDSSRLRSVVIELTRMLPRDAGAAGGSVETTVRIQR